MTRERDDALKAAEALKKKADAAIADNTNASPSTSTKQARQQSNSSPANADSAQSERT